MLAIDGGDIGVESAGFMPPRLSAGDAYLADRSPTPAVSPAVRSLPTLEPEAASRMFCRKWLRAFTGRQERRVPS